MLNYLRTGFLLPVFLFVVIHTAEAQDAPQEEIFPSLTGNELLDSLKAYYKPDNVLSYNNARAELFGNIYSEDDYVTCVYTGAEIWIDPAYVGNPATFAYENDPRWNTEHIYPQSFGAGSGNARSDMHHLQPILASVNISRSNYPFAFLEAAEVNRWWKGDESSFDIPPGDHNLWSKTKSSPHPQEFEVFDQSKGNVARSMFYFYTMYRDEADEADPEYFINQINVLRSYHNTDEVDSTEVARTHHIAQYQNDRPNPFVLDTTLVRRAYFTNYNHDFIQPEDPFSFTGTYNFVGDSEETEDKEISEELEYVAFSAFQRIGVSYIGGVNAFNSSNWPTASQADPGYYVSFEIAADENRHIEFSGHELNFSIRRSGTGPMNFRFEYIMDGGLPLQLVSETLPDNTSDHSYDVNLPSTQEISDIEFRLYAWNAGGSGGTLRLNNLSLSGTTAPRPAVFTSEIQGPSAGWHLLASPVRHITIGDFFEPFWTQGFPGADSEDGQPNVFTFGDAEGSLSKEFHPVESSEVLMVPGTGYAVFLFNDDRNGVQDDWPKILNINGVENEQANFTLTYSGDEEHPENDGWNLVGNPFSSGMDLEKLSYTDISEVMYVYDKTNVGDEYRFYEIGDEQNSEFDGIIPPFQGFWVKAVNSSSAIAPVTKSEVEANGSSTVYKRSEIPVVKLGLTYGDYQSNAYLKFSYSGSRDITRRDAFKLKPLSGHEFQLYSLAGDDIAIASKHLPMEFSGVMRIPIQISSTFSGLFTLTPEKVEHLPSQWNVILTDNENGSAIDLRDSDPYEFEFTASPEKRAAEPGMTMAVRQAEEKSRFTVEISPRVTGVDKDDLLPRELTLSQNYPNPFNPSTVISYELPETGHVHLAVYDMLGREVSVLVSGKQTAGRHELTWDASPFASGMYVYRVVAGGKTLTRTMILIR